MCVCVCVCVRGGAVMKFCPHCYCTHTHTKFVAWVRTLFWYHTNVQVMMVQMEGKMLDDCILADNGKACDGLSSRQILSLLLSFARVRSPLCLFCSLRLSLSFYVCFLFFPSVVLSFSFSHTHARRTQEVPLSPPPLSVSHALSPPLPSLPLRASVALSRSVSVFLSLTHTHTRTGKW